MSGQLPDCDTVGVGQKEQSFSAVRSAAFRRAEDARFHAVTHAAKVGIDSLESLFDVPGDILDKQDRRSCFSEYAAHMGPDKSFILDSPALPRHTEWLTRVARSDDIHDATPWFAVEGADVRPDRSLIQGRFFHPGHESGRSVGVSLDPTNNAVLGDCK